MTRITSWHSNTASGSTRFHFKVLKWSMPGYGCINRSEVLNRSQLRPIYKKDILVIAPTKSYPTPAVIFHHASLHSLLMSVVGILPVAMVSLFMQCIMQHGDTNYFCSMCIHNIHLLKCCPT